MGVQVLVPDLGVEPEQTIVVSVWHSDTGDEVIEGERLVELLVGSATFDLAAPANGYLAEIVAYEDDEVRCGDILGWIEPTDDDNDH